MKKFHHLDTIISPTITEKATFLSEQNKIVFKVHRGAKKNTIKNSIEKIFKVNVIKINIPKKEGVHPALSFALTYGIPALGGPVPSDQSFGIVYISGLMSY